MFNKKMRIQSALAHMDTRRAVSSLMAGNPIKAVREFNASVFFFFFSCISTLLHVRVVSELVFQTMPQFGVAINVGPYSKHQCKTQRRWFGTRQKGVALEVVAERGHLPTALSDATARFIKQLVFTSRKGSDQQQKDKAFKLVAGAGLALFALFVIMDMISGVRTWNHKKKQNE